MASGEFDQRFDGENLKKKTISGLFWRFGERISAQLISFIVSVVLARILLPEDYGIVAIVTIFITLADAFVTSGLGTSLVQKKSSDHLDFSTMFFSSIAFSLVMYLILFLAAPVVASMYNNPLLIPVLRVMGIRLPIAAINSIQQAYVQKEMIYKKFFFATIIGTIISAFVGIGMAVGGFGVWALVAQYLTNASIDTLVLFLTIKWRPRLEFSMARFKKLFNFGSKIMLTSFIGTFFDQLRGLLIGLKYNAEDLAFANKGDQVPSMIANNTNSTLESVLFPTISKVQDNKDDVKKVTRRLMKISSFVLIPIMFGVFGISANFVSVVLTDKWLACVPFMQIVCVQQCFSILNTVNLQAIKAIGRSDTLLILEFIKKPIYFLMLVVTMQISPVAMYVGNAVYGVVALAINSRPNKKYINYTLFEMVADTAQSFLLSAVMLVPVLLVGQFAINKILALFIQVLVGGITYIGLSYLFKVDSLGYVLTNVKRVLGRRK